MQLHKPSNIDLKCPTCKIQFTSSEQYKLHYRSDFHRYNLKRKLVKLAPVTYQQFDAKKICVQIGDEQQFACGECGKKFGSEKTFNQHVQSKRHNADKTHPQKRDNTKNKPVPFSANKKICLFCKQQSQTFPQNLKHMQSVHSFFIPEITYCRNTQGLIQYLQQKIQIGFLCITCQNKKRKDFYSGQAVRKHMIDKGHSFMKTDQGYHQYEKFYDFSKQFKELVAYQKNKNVPGIQYTEIDVVVREEDIEDEENWEDQSSSRGQDNQIEEDQQQSSSSDGDDTKQQREKHEIDDVKKKIKTYHIMQPTQTKNGELLLPNGKVLGNRKFRYLYKQRYHSPFWLNQSIKTLGCQFSTTAIISKLRLKQLTKYDRVSRKYKNRWQKGELQRSIQNNMVQKYVNTRNSL